MVNSVSFLTACKENSVAWGFRKKDFVLLMPNGKVNFLWGGGGGEDFSENIKITDWGSMKKLIPF